METMGTTVTPVERERLYDEILAIYSNGQELTARECSVILYQNDLVPYPVRQAVHPRITELCKLGSLEECGSKVDEITRKVVTIYRKKEIE